MVDYHLRFHDSRPTTGLRAESARSGLTTDSWPGLTAKLNGEELT